MSFSNTKRNPIQSSQAIACTDGVLIFVHRFFLNVTTVVFFTLACIAPALSQTAAGNRPQNSAVAASPDGGQASDNDAPPKPEQLDAVYQEMAKMIHGGVAEGSALESSIKNSISLFADQKSDAAKTALKNLAASEPNFPPSNLMLAALAYAVNDNLAGKRLLEQAAVSDPDYPDVHFSLGQLALTQQRYSDAEAQAEFALQKIKSGTFDAVTLKYFQTRYYAIKFQTAKARNQTDQAKALLEKLDAVAPEAPQALFGKAEFAFQDNDIDRAMNLLQQLNSVSSGKPQIPQITIARWYQRKGKTENADMWIRKAAADNGENVDVQLTAAQWAMNREHFREALQIIERLEAASKKSNVTQDMRGKIAFAKSDFETAGAIYENLLGANPNNIDYANMLSLAMVHSDNEETRQRAKRLARQVASIQPKSAVALSSMAYALLKTGEPDTARSILGQVVKIPNHTPEVSYIIAYMLAETGQAPQAQSVLEQIVPKNGLFLFREQAEQLLKKVKQTSQTLPQRGE
jgi:tetratricopeptide (TPR) repeat protein